MQNQLISPIDEREAHEWAQSLAVRADVGSIFDVLKLLRTSCKLEVNCPDAEIISGWDQWQQSQMPSQATTSNQHLTRTEALSPVAVQAQLPVAIGKYKIERLLGRGGMGEVYLSEDTMLNRKVALKRLIDLDPESVLLFMREAKVLAAQMHANLVTVFEVGQSEQGPYLAMQYVEGDDLKKRLRYLSAPEKRKAILDIARALSVCHKVGIIHRDVKPANVMVEDGTGQILLMDFGLGKKIETDGSDDGFTQENEIKGTPAFAPLEQFVDIKKSCPASDVYSWGVTAYLVMTDDYPYKCSSAYGYMDFLNQSEKSGSFPPDVHARLLKATGDRQLTDIIMTAMSPIIGDRFVDAGKVVVELESCYKRQESDIVLREKRRKMLSIAVIPVILLLSVMSFMFKMQSDASALAAHEASQRADAEEKAKQAAESQLEAEELAKKAIQDQLAAEERARTLEREKSAADALDYRVKAAVGQARAAREASHYPLAYSELQKALELDPENIDARVLMAQVCDFLVKLEAVDHHLWLVVNVEEGRQDHCLLALLAVDRMLDNTSAEKQAKMTRATEVLKFAINGEQALSGEHLRIGELLYSRYQMFLTGDLSGRAAYSQTLIQASRQLYASWVDNYILGFLWGKEKNGDLAIRFTDEAATYNSEYPPILFYRQRLNRKLAVNLMKLASEAEVVGKQGGPIPQNLLTILGIWESALSPHQRTLSDHEKLQLHAMNFRVKAYGGFKTALVDLRRLQVMFSTDPRIDVDHADCLLEMVLFSGLHTTDEKANLFRQATQTVESLNTENARQQLVRIGQTVFADLVRTKHRAVRYYLEGNPVDRTEVLQAVQRFERTEGMQRYTAPFRQILQLRDNPR
jgi:serine/threonine protein kinase